MAVAGIAVIVATGFTQPTLAFAIGIPIAIVTVALSLTGINKSVSSVIVFVVVASTFQLLQNSRADLGLYYLSPYSWAFAPNPIEEKITTAIDVQGWLLKNTTNQDQILTWVDGSWTQVDRELYAVANAKAPKQQSPSPAQSLKAAPKQIRKQSTSTPRPQPKSR